MSARVAAAYTLWLAAGLALMFGGIGLAAALDEIVVWLLPEAVVGR